MWLERLGQSFRNAFRGIADAIKTQRNLRIHLTAASYVLPLGVLAELDAPRWAAVLLSCGAVIAAELFNTALEHLCDVVCPQQNPLIGAAKDAAAGAVLVLAIVAVGVGLATFLPWLAAGGLLAHPRSIAIFILILPTAILWIRGKRL